MSFAVVIQFWCVSFGIVLPHRPRYEKEVGTRGFPHVGIELEQKWNQNREPEPAVPLPAPAQEAIMGCPLRAAKGNILAEGAIALSVTLSGGALFAS